MVDNGEHLSRTVLEERRQRDGKGDESCHESKDAYQSRATTGQQEERQSSEKRDVDRPSKHNQKFRRWSAICMAVWLTTPRISWG